MLPCNVVNQMQNMYTMYITTKISSHSSVSMHSCTILLQLQKSHPWPSLLDANGRHTSYVNLGDEAHQSRRVHGQVADARMRSCSSYCAAFNSQLIISSLKGSKGCYHLSPLIRARGTILLCLEWRGRTRNVERGIFVVRALDLQDCHSCEGRESRRSRKLCRCSRYQDS